MEHYWGPCYAWDVVNEALNEDSTYRESFFYEVLGEEYIKLAFRTAAGVEPDGVKLYYNDYNIQGPGQKAKAALAIIRMLQEDGIKIDGVGLQSHFLADCAIARRAEDNDGRVLPSGLGGCRHRVRCPSPATI